MIYQNIQYETKRKDIKTNALEIDTFNIHLLTAEEMQKQTITAANLESYFLVKHSDGFKLIYVYGTPDRIIQLEVALDTNSHLGKLPGFQAALNALNEPKNWNDNNLIQLGQLIGLHRNSPADNKVLDDRFKFMFGKTGGANGAGEYGAFYVERANPANKQFFKQDKDYDKVYCEAVISQLMRGVADKDKQRLIAEVDLAVIKENTPLPDEGSNVYLRSRLFKGYCDLWEDAYFAFKYLPQYEGQRNRFAKNGKNLKQLTAEQIVKKLKSPKGRAKFFQQDAYTHAMIENGRYTEGLIEGIVDADFLDDPDLHAENFGTVRKAREINVKDNNKPEGHQQKSVKLIEEEVIKIENGIQFIRATGEDGNIYTFQMKVEICNEKTNTEKINDIEHYEIIEQHLVETITDIKVSTIKGNIITHLKPEINRPFETQRLEITKICDGTRKTPKHIYQDVDTVRIDAGGGGGDNRFALLGKGRKYDGELHFINPGITKAEKSIHDVANLARYRPSKEGPPPYFSKFPEKFVENGAIYLNYLKKSLLPENEIKALFDNVFQNCNAYYGKNNLEKAADRLGVKLAPQDDEITIKQKIKDHMLRKFQKRQAYGKKVSITLLINQNIQAIKNNDNGFNYTNNQAIELLQYYSINSDKNNLNEIKLFELLNLIINLKIDKNRQSNAKENNKLKKFKIDLCETLLNAYRKNPNEVHSVIEDVHSKINQWNRIDSLPDSIKYLNREDLLSRINKLGNGYEFNLGAKEKLAQIKKTLQAKLNKAELLAGQEFDLEIQQIDNIVYDYENNILPYYKKAMDSMKECTVKVVFKKPTQAEYDSHTWYLVNPDPLKKEGWELFRPVNTEKASTLEKVELPPNLLELLSKKENEDALSVANQPGEDPTQPLLSQASSQSAIVYNQSSEEYEPTQPLITEINAFRNNLSDVKRQQKDSINAFMAQASWYSNKHALLNSNEDWKVAMCAGIGALLGMVLGAAAGLAVGAAAGGVLGNVVGAVAGGSVAGVIAAVKGAGIGAAIGTAIAFTVFGGIGAGVGAFFSYKGSERYQLNKNSRHELKEKNIEMQEFVREEARTKLSPAKPS